VKKISVIGFTVFCVLIFSISAQASQYDLKQSTPEVERAISNRQSNYSGLQALKAQGAIGETSRGYVHTLVNSPETQALVESENQNRKVIYETIASQNNLGPSGFSLVETVFGEVQRDKARSGEAVQNAAGEWVRK